MFLDFLLIFTQTRLRMSLSVQKDNIKKDFTEVRIAFACCRKKDHQNIFFKKSIEFFSFIRQMLLLQSLPILLLEE